LRVKIDYTLDLTGKMSKGYFGACVMTHFLSHIQKET
jgi:hypothetical protein